MTKPTRAPIAIVSHRGTVHPLPDRHLTAYQHIEANVAKYIYTKEELVAAMKAANQARSEEIEDARSVPDATAGLDLDAGFDAESVLDEYVPDPEQASVRTSLQEAFGLQD